MYILTIDFNVFRNKWNRTSSDNYIFCSNYFIRCSNFHLLRALNSLIKINVTIYQDSNFYNSIDRTIHNNVLTSSALDEDKIIVQLRTRTFVHVATKSYVLLTRIVPKPVNMSTPRDFIELVKLERIFDARLFA